MRFCRFVKQFLCLFNVQTVEHALGHLGAKHGHMGGLLQALNPFGDDSFVQGSRQLDDMGKQHRAFAVLIQIAQEGSIDLDDVEGELRQADREE